MKNMERIDEIFKKAIEENPLKVKIIEDGGTLDNLKRKVISTLIYHSDLENWTVDNLLSLLELILNYEK